MKVAVEFVTVPREGEKENGDAVVVRRDGDRVLVAVVDALGHGVRAAEAATVAVRCLEQIDLGRGLRPVVERMHEQLRGTRGAAAMLLLFRQYQVEGCGVGNVSLRSYRARIPAMLTPGVLGGSLNRLRLFQGEVSPGDRIILFSDGISTRFDDEGFRTGPALTTCQLIMERHRKSHDDATVMVTDIEDGGQAGGDPGVPGSTKPPVRAA